jgi:hypothetical protein
VKLFTDGTTLIVKGYPSTDLDSTNELRIPHSRCGYQIHESAMRRLERQNLHGRSIARTSEVIGGNAIGGNSPALQNLGSGGIEG